MDDSISRQAAIDANCIYWCNRKYSECSYRENIGTDEQEVCDGCDTVGILKDLPSAHPEPLTDSEQRIFLAAMGREEKVCKEVDELWQDSREPYEDSLVGVCREIERKVKKALWTN